jgi:hypothetical protein
MLYKITHCNCKGCFGSLDNIHIEARKDSTGFRCNDNVVGEYTLQHGLIDYTDTKALSVFLKN